MGVAEILLLNQVLTSNYRSLSETRRKEESRKRGKSNLEEYPIKDIPCSQPAIKSDPISKFKFMQDVITEFGKGTILKVEFLGEIFIYHVLTPKGIKILSDCQLKKDEHV